MSEEWEEYGVGDCDKLVVERIRVAEGQLVIPVLTLTTGKFRALPLGACFSERVWFPGTRGLGIGKGACGKEVEWPVQTVPVPLQQTVQMPLGILYRTEQQLVVFTHPPALVLHIGRGKAIEEEVEDPEGEIIPWPDPAEMGTHKSVGHDIW